MLKWLLTITVVVLIFGATSPWLRDLMMRRLGYRRVPGDFQVEHKGKRFWFPLGSTILFSLMATLLFWFLS